MKPIRLSGHAQTQIDIRGTFESEVVDAIRTATWGAAERGRLECRKDFAFAAEWNDKYYDTKQVRPFSSRRKR